MNRNYFRALSSLLRQAAAVADISALPSSSKITLPASAALLHTLGHSIPEPFERHQSPSQPCSSLPSAPWHRNLSSQAAAAIKPIDERPSVYGVDDRVINDLTEQPDFIQSADYLQERLEMPRTEILRHLAKVSYSAYTPEGQLYPFKTPKVPLIDSNIKPMLDYLVSIPGVNLTRAIRNAPFLLCDYAADREKLDANKEWLESTLELEGDALGKIVSSNGYVLTRPVESMQMNLDVLGNLNFTPAQQGKIIMRAPRLLALRSLRMEDGLTYFREKGFSDERIKKVMWKFPSAFCTTPVHIARVLDWLQVQGLHPAAAVDTITRFPAILGYSLEKNLDPTIQYFDETLNFSPLMKQRILTYAPDVLGRSLKRLENNVKAMQVYGITGTNLESFISGYPGVLRYDLSSPIYAAKFRYLTEELKVDIATTLRNNPMYVSYSIERIASRGAYLDTVGRSRKGVTSWLSWNDADFAKTLAATSLESWLDFKKGWMHSAEAKKWLMVEVSESAT